jgi:hypothetical protein
LHIAVLPTRGQAKQWLKSFAKQPGNLVDINWVSKPGKREPEEIKEYSLCVFIPYLAGYCIKHLSTKWAQD